MNLITLGMVAALGMGELDTPQAPATPAAPAANVSSAPCASDAGLRFYSTEARAPFQSAPGFDSFIGPMTNPFLAKDPRANTQINGLYLFNDLPGSTGGGNIQIATLQASVALNDNWSITTDKNGFGRVDSNLGIHNSGWLNTAVGLKYTWGDIESQTLFAAGFQYEGPWGGNNISQGYGSGILTTFLTGGKGFDYDIHVLNTFGFQFPIDSNANSSFLYNSFHIDKKIGDFYPLFEANWYHYTGGGNSVPFLGIEGDGLINIGAGGVAGNDLVTIAFGAKAKIGTNMEVGAAWEFPVTGRKDINENRLVSSITYRY